MIKQYKHILIILLDGILQVQANKDEKPLYRATAKEHECDEYKLNYTDWVLNHQYFLFYQDPKPSESFHRLSD